MDLSLRMALYGSVTAIALAATPALAQTPAEVGEVIVTAQKRSESVQRVPAAITAISAETLEERGVDEVADLRFIAPSVEVNNLLGNTGVSIRGVGLNLLINNAAPAVAIHMDGVYQPISAMGDLAQVDLERVEVLRGPQGTLYGRNANAGAVNFITRSPTSEFEGYVQAGYASYEETHLQAVVNVPFSDRIRARAVVDWNDRGKGFYENVIPGEDDMIKGRTFSGRLRVTADITDDLTFDFTGAQLNQTGPVQSYVLRNVPAAAVLNGAIAPQEPWKTSVNDPVDFTRNYTLLSGAFTWQLGDLQLKSISGWQRLGDEHLGDDDATNLSVFLVHRLYRSETFTQEFNASGSAGPVDAVVGAFYMDDYYYGLIDYFFPRGLPPLPANSRLVYEQYKLNTKALAGFADATWNVTDRFRLLAGIRFSKDRIANTQRNFLTFGPVAPTISCPLRQVEIEFTSTTPRAGAQFDLSEESNVYATYSKGFKDGGFNRTSCQQTYEPEEITAYEIGVKSRLFDRTLVLNAAAFWYDYTGLQLNQQVGLGQLITNAAAAEVKGAEVEVLWQPTPNWTFNANATLLDATYTNFFNVDPLNRPLGFQDLSGRYLNNAPEQALNAGVTYRTAEMEFGHLTFRADLSYRSKIYFREFNLPLDSQPAFTVLNLAAIWESPAEKYRVRVFANNATEEAYITGISSAEALGARYGSWGPPRQLGIELRAAF